MSRKEESMQVQVVHEALHQVLNKNMSPRVRRRADSFLAQFRQSPEALDLALSVLQQDITPDSSQQLERSFAALTAYKSVAHYIRKFGVEEEVKTLEQMQHQEAVSSHFAGVCQQLWQILIGPNAHLEEASSKKSIASAIAVILLRFQPPAVENEQGPTLVSTLQSLMESGSAGKDPMVLYMAALLVLYWVPEEVKDKQVKFSKIKRTQCKDMVRQAAPDVVGRILPSLAASLDSNPSTTEHERNMLMMCFSSWVELGCVDAALLLDSTLLDRAFRETLTPCSENALSAIREVVSTCKESAYMPLMEKLMHHFMELGKVVVERYRADPDSIRFCLVGVAKALSDCGEHLVPFFVDYTQELAPGSLTYDFLETVLAFTSMSDVDASNETMDFWILLRQYVCGKHNERLYEFDAFVQRLLDILVERTKIPLNWETLAIAPRETFTLYRSQVRSVFRSIATVNAKTEDDFIIGAIHAIFRLYEAFDAGRVDGGWWANVEVYVHALSAVAKSIRTADTSLVPQLLQLLSRRETMHVALLRTTTIFLGVMGNWFVCHPEYLDSCAFDIFSQSFEHPPKQHPFPFRVSEDSNHAGAVSLRKLTHRCGRLFYSERWMHAMLGLYRSSFSAGPSILSSSDVKIIVESVALVVADVPYSEGGKVVDSLMDHAFSSVTTRFPTLAAEDDAAAEVVCELLSHLQVLAKHLPAKTEEQTVHPLASVLRRQWTSLDQILIVLGEREEVVEGVCDLLVTFLHQARGQALTFLWEVIPVVMTQFARTMDGHYLDVVRGVLEATRNDRSFTSGLTELVTRAADLTLNKLRTAAAVDDFPHLLTSYFALVKDCGRHHPMVLVSSNQLLPAIDLVLYALSSSDPDVGSSALNLLLEVGIWYGEVKETPEDLLRSSEWEGKKSLSDVIETLMVRQDGLCRCLRALFSAAAGALPACLMDQVADVLRLNWKHFGASRTQKLVEYLMNDDTFIGTNVTMQVRTDFCKSVRKQECVANKHKFRRTLSAFCDHFRKAQQVASG